MFSLHTSPTLRNAKVGNPVGEDVNGVWRCSFQEVTEAIQTGIAFVEDFAIIDGMCVWGKEEDGNGNIGKLFNNTLFAFYLFQDTSAIRHVSKH